MRCVTIKGCYYSGISMGCTRIVMGGEILRVVLEVVLGVLLQMVLLVVLRMVQGGSARGCTCTNA